MLQAVRCRLESRWGHRNFFLIYLILPAALSPGVYSAWHNEYHKIFLRGKRDRRARLTTLPSSVSRLSRQCGILDISHPYRPPRFVTGIALLVSLDFICKNSDYQNTCRQLSPYVGSIIHATINPNYLFSDWGNNSIALGISNTRQQHREMPLLLKKVAILFLLPRTYLYNQRQYM
jgi:hypothetical protein